MMIDSILGAIQQPFFLRSLLVVVLLASVFPLLGTLVVLRQEANIAHTFAHVGLLGIAVGLWFDFPIVWVVLASVVLTVVLLYVLGSSDRDGQVIHNEIGAQLGLVGAILLVSQMSGYRADISSYLFGDILLLGVHDVWVIAGVVLLVGLLYWLFSNKRYAISMDVSLAKSKGLSPNFLYLFYLFALGLLIGGAMQIIGVLLVSAFLILPSSIGKIMASDKKQWQLFSVGICLLVSVFALFLSWYLDLPSGASIIACLLLVYLFFMLFDR